MEMKRSASGKNIIILILLLITIFLLFIMVSTETKSRIIREENKIQNEMLKEVYEMNDILTEENTALKEIIDNEDEAQKNNPTLGEEIDKTHEIEDGYISLMNLLKYKNEKLYQLVDSNREFMDSRFELNYYFDPSFVNIGDNIAGFVVSEFMSDEEDFFMQFSVSFDGKAVIEGEFVYLSGDYDDHIFFELDERFINKLPFVDVDQEVKYIFVKNYEDYLSQSEIELLTKKSSIKKNIEITNLVIGGQMGSDIYYGCEISLIVE